MGNNELKKEDIIKEIDELVGDEYQFLRIEKQPNRPNKVVLLHNKCNKEYAVEMSKFRKGNRCRCNLNKENKRITCLEDFEEEMKEKKGNDYSLCEETEFKGMKKPIIVVHNLCGKKWKTTPYEFLRRKRGDKVGCECKYCNQYGKFKHFSFEELNAKIKEIDNEYEFIDKSNYENTMTKATMLHHKCNNTYPVKPNDFLNGHRCPYCNTFNKDSNGENELLDFIKNTLKVKAVKDITTISPYHLDVNVLKSNIAFEYDGLYWHSVESLTNRNVDDPKNYHLNKTEMSKEKGIRLIHIFEDEWIEHKTLCKNKIRYILGKSNKKRLYARSNNSYIKEIASKKGNKFLNKYHLQGGNGSAINLGLYIKSPKTKKYILVSVMTFCEPRRALGQSKNSKYDYELFRFASSYNYVVLNGFSSLFKYFTENYEWNRLITYADRRWSEGDVYFKNGWKFIRNNKPDYWYTDGHKRFHRYTFKKQELKKFSKNPNSKYYKKFKDIYDDSKTEEQIMREAKFYRIYDCGTMVFEYTRND